MESPRYFFNGIKLEKLRWNSTGIFRVSLLESKKSLEKVVKIQKKSIEKVVRINEKSIEKVVKIRKTPLKKF